MGLLLIKPAELLLFYTGADISFDALEYVKIARSELPVIAGNPKLFTFAHRRFQEYFATCTVLKQPESITPRQLLSDGRWRETAVVLCQSQMPDSLTALLGEARQLVQTYLELVPVVSPAINPGEGSIEGFRHFDWPPTALHVLRILQNGFVGRMDLLPTDIRVPTGQVILSGYQHGTLVDKKWALEVAGVAPPEVLLSLLRDALKSPSRWLRDTAYQQAAKLLDMPQYIAMGIRASLIDLCTGTGRLSFDKLATQAHLSRLSDSSQFLSALRLLLAMPYAEVILQVACLLLFFRIINPGTWSAVLVLAVASLSWTAFFIAIPARPPRTSPRDRPHEEDDQEFDRFYLATSLFLFRCSLFLLAFGIWAASERGKLSLNVIDPILVFGNIPTKLDLLLIYAAAWAPFAGFAVLLGTFVHPVWWVAIPSSPLVFGVLSARLR
jgi:hypothetical protein